MLRYDYASGRNLNVIQTQSGEEDGPLFDNERANGTTYYYLPAKAKAKYCNVRKRDMRGVIVSRRGGAGGRAVIVVPVFFA